MKKTVLFIAFLLFGFACFGQVQMPYIIQYNTESDTVIHSLQTVDGIYIDASGQELIHDGETEWSSLIGMDTVYVYRDRFKRLTGDTGDWEEVLMSSEQVYFYKGNEDTGKPQYLLNVIVTDSIPDGYFIYTEFDEEGYPHFMNFNDSCFMFVSSIYGEYYDAVIIAKDMSSFSIDSIRMTESPAKLKERNEALARAGYGLSPGQETVELSNHFIGGVAMLSGGITMLIGCSMLVPGANIAVGATIALAGAATFISGAFLTAHATDQLVSDGSHTQGFMATSQVFGFLGSFSGENFLVDLLRYAFQQGGIAFLQNVLSHYAETNHAYQQALRQRNMRLTTGRAELVDVNSHTARLNGFIGEKLNPNDRFGIMVSLDPDALTVEHCQLLNSSQAVGAYYCDFSGLEPLQGYYYRAYYYSTELAGLGPEVSPWIVSNVNANSFRMPGVVTLEHEQGNSSNSYWLHGAFQDVAGQHTHTVGFCYSYSNETPTYDDETMEQTVYDNGEFTGHLFLNSEHNCCYYRAYAIIDGQVAYGDVKQIGIDVITYEPSDITQTTALGHGEVVCGDVCDVTERGFCWSTYHNPTTSGPHVIEGQGTGFFNCMMTDLNPGTSYFVRAYAVVDAITVYGNEWPFTTVDHPTVTTYEVTNITSTAALCGGEVTCVDDCVITERGVCWGTNHNPTVNGLHITCGTGTGTFTCSLEELSEGTAYYVRAYAIADGQTMYGEEVTFTTLTTPTVTTAAVTNIGEHTATGGGTVVSDNGSPVTVRGICWSTSHNPTTSNSHATNGSGTGSFTVNMTGLTAHTTYYVRAYATNSVGTEYGNEVSFTTDEEPTGDWVDLGLPSGLLWATRNVGASSPEDYGDYFAWGETSPKSVYNWDTYQYYTCGYQGDDYHCGLTKYCTTYGYFGYTDNLTILQPGDDAATANWGSGARMPTKQEWEELEGYCSSVWTTQNGVNGRRFTGPNGNTLFLPAAGYRWLAEFGGVGSNGNYWSSSLIPDSPDSRAWYFDFNSGYARMDGRDRIYGHSVRAVRSSGQN